MRQRLARTHERISTLSINGLFELMYTRFMHKNTLKSLYKKTPYFIFPFAFSLYSHPLFAGDVSKTHLAPTTDTLSQNSTADPMSAPISTQATSAAPIKPAKQNSIAPEKNVTLDRKAEWSFLESEPFPQNKKMARALAEAVDLFIAANPHSPQAPKAWALMASLYEQAGDNKTALVDYLHLIYEYPNSSEVLGAQSHFLALAKKTLSSHLKTQWEALASPPTNKKTENRLALMLAGIAKIRAGFCASPHSKSFGALKLVSPTIQTQMLCCETWPRSLSRTRILMRPLFSFEKYYRLILKASTPLTRNFRSLLFIIISETIKELSAPTKASSRIIHKAKRFCPPLKTFLLCFQNVLVNGHWRFRQIKKS